MTRRALLALGLYLGFYGTGALLILALVALPWMQTRYGSEPGFSGLLSLGGAGYVVWALWPRRERWVEPGIELTRDTQPRLWAVLDRVATDAGHPIPRHVYLVRDVQAFATSRPRWLGLRREPVIALGLPVFSFLSEREIRAVVAHEMGHHVGGDVRLGPWQYRTGRAIAAALDRLEGSNVFLNLPFYAYGQLYLRLTARASRDQEVRADELAARLAGSRFLGSALLSFEQHAGLWAGFIQSVVWPMLNEGFRAPVLEGYERYLRAVDFEEHRREFKAGITRPPALQDTHPSLIDRLKPLSTPCEPRPLSVTTSPPLLNQRAACEDLMLAAQLNKPESLAELRLLRWDEWGETLLPLMWSRVVEPRREVFEEMSLRSLPDALEDKTLWNRLRQGLNVYSPEAQRQQVGHWLACWFAWSLHKSGYRVTSEVGAESQLERGSLRIQPFVWVRDLGRGTRTRAEWDELCAQVG